MLCKMLRHANPVNVRNLFFAMVFLAIFVLACSRDSDKHPWSVELREAEHKTVRHPDKRYYATIWPDGIQVSFDTAQGHFGSYTFPHKEFPSGEPMCLSCPGSPDLLPMRVVRLNGEANHKYKIEWLAKSPTTSDGACKVVSSY